jgi:TorA maturation chaperone TorD
MTQERAARGSHGHVVDQLDLARAREYALLANLLTRGPGTELIGRLALLQGDATPLGMAHAALAEAAGRSSQASAAREYFDLFVGLGQGQILPYASQYLGPRLITRARNCRTSTPLGGKQPSWLAELCKV